MFEIRIVRIDTVFHQYDDGNGRVGRIWTRMSYHSPKTQS